MPNQTTKNGFTIIEVMIVLAIAALILLILFLVVPTVQRNARNLSRKHDAAFLVSQRQQYDELSGAVLSVGQATCPGMSPGFITFCQYVDSGMSYYMPSDITIIDNGYTPPTSIPSVTTETLITESYLVCNNTDTGATTVGAGPFDAAVLYALETNNGQLNQCLQGSLAP